MPSHGLWIKQSNITSPTHQQTRNLPELTILRDTLTDPHLVMAAETDKVAEENAKCHTTTNTKQLGKQKCTYCYCNCYQPFLVTVTKMIQYPDWYHDSVSIDKLDQYPKDLITTTPNHPPLTCAKLHQQHLLDRTSGTPP